MIKKLSIVLILVASVVVLLGVFTLLTTPAMAASQPPITAPMASSPSYQLDWDVSGSGGSTMQSATFIMHSTIGQTVITPMNGSNYTMKNGFWSGIFEGLYEVFLPMITK